MGSKTISLNFLLYPCEECSGKFVAHCLEMDIVAVGDTKDQAISLLKELVEDAFAAAEKDGTQGKLFTPAPGEFWQRFASAKHYTPGSTVVERRIRARPVNHVSYSLCTA
jgi:predicted RNase H-like HicB family nuclease